MKIRMLIPALSLFFLVCLLIVIADVKGTEYLLGRVPKIPFGDKVGHFVLFGFLALLINITLNFRHFTFRKLRCFYGSIMVLVFATLEECSQLFLSTRSFDFLDMTADLLGIWLLSHPLTRKAILKTVQKATRWLSISQ